MVFLFGQFLYLHVINVLILGVGIAIFTPFLVSKQNIVQVDAYTMYMDVMYNRRKHPLENQS